MALVRVREAHAQFVNGVPKMFAAGQLVESDSPFVRKHRHLFQPVEDAVSSDEQPAFRAGATETADAAPGAPRARTVPPRKRAAKKAAPVKADAAPAEPAEQADEKPADD